MRARIAIGTPEEARNDPITTYLEQLWFRRDVVGTLRAIARCANREEPNIGRFSTKRVGEYRKDPIYAMYYRGPDEKKTELFRMLVGEKNRMVLMAGLLQDCSSKVFSAKRAVSELWSPTISKMVIFKTGYAKGVKVRIHEKRDVGRKGGR